MDAAFVWAYEHGRPPRSTEWQRAENGHPSHKTVQRLFGSWNNMIVQAGYEPVRGSGVRRGRPMKEAA